MAEPIVHRRAERHELERAVRWAADEGWNPGVADADVFWETDPAGFVVAELDGEVVATGSIVAYGDAHGFMGFFIVRPDLRGQGIGRDFWLWRRDTLLARLRPGAAVGMDGVLEMVPFYAAGGFELAHRNIRMTGVPRGGVESDALCRIGERDLGALSRFDREHFGFDRDVFVRRWIGAEGTVAFADVSDAGDIRGYGVMRRCHTGRKVGPLFAEEPEIAARIARHLVAQAGGDRVSLDVPEVNPAALDLAEQLGLQEDFACGRMYHGRAPRLPWDEIFGVTTFELG